MKSVHQEWTRKKDYIFCYSIYMCVCVCFILIRTKENDKKQDTIKIRKNNISELELHSIRNHNGDNNILFFYKINFTFFFKKTYFLLYIEKKIGSYTFLLLITERKQLIKFIQIQRWPRVRETCYQVKQRFKFQYTMSMF